MSHSSSSSSYDQGDEESGSPSPDPSPVLESPAKSSSSKSSSPKKDVTSPHPTGFIEDNSESIEAARSDSVPAEREEDVEQRSKTMWTRSTTPRERRGQGPVRDAVVCVGIGVAIPRGGLDGQAGDCEDGGGGGPITCCIAPIISLVLTLWGVYHTVVAYTAYESMPPTLFWVYSTWGVFSIVALLVLGLLITCADNKKVFRLFQTFSLFVFIWNVAAHFYFREELLKHSPNETLDERAVKITCYSHLITAVILWCTNSIAINILLIFSCWWDRVCGHQS